MFEELKRVTDQVSKELPGDINGSTRRLTRSCLNLILAELAKMDLYDVVNILERYRLLGETEDLIG